MPSRFKDHFSGVASGYAAHRPTYPPALADFLAGLVARPDTAWDCGCGTGQLSLLLADRFRRVFATDASREQIEKATPHPNVEYLCAPAESSGLPDACADLAVAAQAAHWFDLPAYYGEVRRVARPGAAIALVTYGNPLVDGEIDPLLGHFYSKIAGPYWPPERRMVEEGYRTLPFPFQEIPTPDLEIRTSWSLSDLIGYVETWSALRGLEKAQGRRAIEKFYEDLAGMWGLPSERRSVRWPLAIRAGPVG
ncbi:MAG TPA: class I SAM-dependent methyltransferase [Thermoanaerobaculia bacterium]